MREFYQLRHCMKSIQTRSFFWSVFSRIHPEYAKIRTRKKSVFGHFSLSARETENSFEEIKVIKNGLLMLKQLHLYIQELQLRMIIIIAT